MKRLWIAILLLIIVGAITVSEYIYVTSSVQKHIYALDEIDKKISQNDREDAYDMLCRLENRFEDTDRVFNAFLLHSDIDNISGNIAMLKEYSKSTNNAQFLALSAKTKLQLLSLSKSEKPLIDNIL
ncbi:MAG: DUF4363 family protein [Oscillospiraceae bacterium]|nr:DUF4363 family protein [Candidatus Ruminococcus equi]